MDRARLIVGMLAGVALAVGGGFAIAAAGDPVSGEPVAAERKAAAYKPSPLQQARDDCNADGATTEGSDGLITFVADHAGVSDGDFDDPETDIPALFCLLDAVGAPASVTARIQDTRALDGMQDASWEGYKASWTYHPDDGLNLIITES